MLNLNLYGNPIESVFELIGNKENDLSKSIAWAFANCPSLLLDFLNDVFDGAVTFDDEDAQFAIINLEESEKESNYLGTLISKDKSIAI